jgi:hypothetical protein
MKLSWKSAAFAVVAIAVALALVSFCLPGDAFAAVPHSDLITASAALIAMRSEHASLVAQASAKIGEIKAGLSAEAIAAIEADHRALLEKATAKAGEITAEETRIATAAPAPVKPWAAAFYASAEAANMTLTDLNAIVLTSASHDLAKDALIAKMAAAHAPTVPLANGARATIIADGADKFAMGVTKSIIARVSMFNTKGKPDAEGERNEFSGYSMRELARMSLEVRGIRNLPHDPMAMIAMAMAPVVMAAGQLSTSDFVNVLANVANKAMLKGYEEAAETFDVWTGKGTLTDFKIAKRVDLGLFPSLSLVDEGAEYSYASMSDRGVNLVLATYGKIFSITRQAIINDDLGAFTKVPAKMGTAAKRTIGNLVYAILTSNPTAPDGTALFHANHANLGAGVGSALSATSLDAGRTAMGRQTDPDNIKQGLNISPAFLLLPKTLEGSGKQIINSQSEPGQNNSTVANRVAGMATPVAESRLDVSSTTAWFLAADPATTDTIEVDYLNGVETPTLEQRDGWGVDGVEMKVRQDAGVTLLDHRGLYKGVGA